MPSFGDGHTALDTKILETAQSSDLRLSLVKRDLGAGKEDLVIHGASSVLGSRITSLVVLQGAGFRLSDGECPHFSGQRCLYKEFPVGASLNLGLMAATVTGVVPRLREVENALNNCGWSIFRELLRPIEEGHRAAQKQVLKTKEDATFKYVMTYTKDQYGNGRFVTHYIPKQGPDYPPELLAVINYLELKRFDGCPESAYRQCFYTTYNNPQEREYSYFDTLEIQFGKACSALIEIDTSLRQVGLQILDFEPVKPSVVKGIAKAGGTVVNTGHEVVVVSGKVIESPKASTSNTFQWDAFICHASEDKDRFVRQLATELRSKGLNIWYDEFTLKVGDKLRQCIEHGLANSRYGVVILSPYFFAKDWPKDELDGLDSKERNGQKVILPIWLDVDVDYVAKYSPMLSGRLATKASYGMKKVVADLLAVINQS